ncbi:hypothetical protein Y032_0026g1473 [Ancylostoma ceylanicum]|uniref:Uncharacterized protein n=1 Tax=Ancylostoma ceylanicum TaxID=53326 RepID=A0A016UUT4_9BILA|nr:hypothetical protein Y032_0026g1473 [Ancylostoma ceylanicum]
MVLREIPTLVDGYSLGDMKRPTIEDDDPEQKHEDEIDNAKPLISLDLVRDESDVTEVKEQWNSEYFNV